MSNSITLLAGNFINTLKEIASRNSIHTMDQLIYSPAKLNIISESELGRQ